MITYLLDRIYPKTGFAGADMTGTTAQDSAVIDRQGFNSAVVDVIWTAGTAGTLTLTAVDGADTSPATSVTFAVTPDVINAASAGLKTYQINLSGFNRYFKLTLTPSLSTNHSTVAMVVTLGDPEINPATGTAVTPLRKA